MDVKQAVVWFDAREELDPRAELGIGEGHRHEQCDSHYQYCLGEVHGSLDDGHVHAVARLFLVLRRLGEFGAQCRREDQRVEHRCSQGHDQRDWQVLHEVADNAGPEQQRREGGDARHRRGDDRTSHPLGGEFERLFARHAFRHAPLGEFGDDDRVVDEHADGQNEREQHDHIDREAHQREGQDAHQER